LAEVVWWVSFEDRPVGTNTVGNGIWDFNEPRELHRRQLLIRPELGQISPTDYTSLQTAFAALVAYWQTSDISASIRAEFNGSNLVYRIRANSLADLTKREYRFAHYPLSVVISGSSPNQYLADQTFPHSAVTTNTNFPLLLPSFSAKSAGVMNNSQTSYVLQYRPQLQWNAPGEDVVLSNLLAFDVQVYDPCARVWPDNPGQLNNSITALVPSDPGYSTAAAAGTATTLVGLGAFVDLAYYRHVNAAAQAIDTALFNNNGFALPYFAGLPAAPLNMNAAQQLQYRSNFGYKNPYSYATYDTWAQSYERDGIDQFANGNYDLQTNGLDDINPVTGQYEYGVDDANERETVPPYSQPLRGIQVKIRLLEPSTRQVRQATVAADFITE
jgi:hypothetical protein